MDAHGRYGFTWQGARVSLQVPGRHMAYNAAVALAVARLLGVPAEAAARGISAVRPTEMRSEERLLGSLALLVDCYNANPQSTRAALDSLAARTGAGPRVALLGTMLELALEKLPAWSDHSPNDLGVVLLELFAYMGDILHYYQDRIANESYLETAAERRSVMNLLRLIGYELRPPQPASADLTLLFEEPAADEFQKSVLIPYGATFETTAEATGEPIQFRYILDELSIDLGQLEKIVLWSTLE